MASVWQALQPDPGYEEARDYLCPLIARTEAEQEKFREAFRRHAFLLGIASPAKKRGEKAPQKEKPPKEASATPPDRRRFFLATALAALLISLGIYAGYSYFGPDATTRAKEVKIDTTALAPALPIDTTGVAEEPAKEDESVALSDLARRDSVSYRPQFETTALDLPALRPVVKDLWFWLAQYKDLASLILWGLLLVFSLGLVLWRRARRQYAARQERGEEPPYRLPIKIRRERPIALAQDFYFALNRLRGREESERERLSIPRTIQATIRRGGMVDFRYEAFSRPVEYLLLIDKNTEQNHQSQLFEHLYQRLVRQEVYAERFFFDGNPLHCWNDRHPTGLPLERLLQLHRNARLLIFSDGYSFLNPATGGLEDWAQQLSSWSNRALLTPAPAAAWNYREAILARLFFVLPANISGMINVVRHFEELPTPSLRDWKYEIGKTDVPYKIDPDDAPGSLARHFSPYLMRWLAACAVYPELHWDLTLELGEVLSPPDQTLVTFSNVAALARLEWFRRGAMPDPVRRQLLSYEGFTADDRRAVREAIVGMLEANVPERTDSYAYEEHQLHLAVNKLLLARMPAEKQYWLKKYREQHAKRIAEDHVAVAELDDQFNRLLDFPLPERLRRLFFPGGRGVLGWRNGMPLVIAGFLALLVLGARQLLPPPCGGDLVEMQDAGEVYCLATPQDSVDFFTLQAVQFIDSLRLGKARSLADSLRRWSARWEPTERAYFDSVFLNQSWNAYKNRAVRLYQDTLHSEAAFVLETLREELIAAGETIPFSEKSSPQRRAGEGAVRRVDFFDDTHLLGLAYYYQNYDSLARARAAEIDTGYFAQHVPNLRHLLTYDFVDSMHYGRVRVRRNGKYGFLDRRGQPIWSRSAQNTPSSRFQELPAPPLPYDHAYNFVGDSALITRRREQCFIDREGNIMNCFNRLLRDSFFQAGEYFFRYVNELGAIVLKGPYEKAGEFTADELAWVKPPGKGYGFIRKDGSEITDFNYDDAGPFREGLAFVSKGSKWGYLNTSGREIIPLRYDGARSFENGAAAVELDGKSFRIDRDGRCIGGDCPVATYRGRVEEEASGRPLSGVQITVRTPDETETSTNRQGSYELDLLEDLSRQTLTIRFQLPDYQPKEEELDIQESNTLPTVRLSPIPPEDADADGITDDEDECPREPGPAATAGCPDQDGDQVADRDDACPQEAGPRANQGCPVIVIDSDIPKPELVLVRGGTFEMGDQFDAGESNEKPVHTVTLGDYYLGKYEVTVQEFSRFAEAAGYQTDAEKGDGSYITEEAGDYNKKAGINWRHDATGKLRPSPEYDHPVLHVSWNDAVHYCNWLSEQHNYQPVYTINGDQVAANWQADGYRLPTEAEWEFAARSRGQRIQYAWGSEDTPHANIADETAKTQYTGWTIWEDYSDGYIHTAPVNQFEQGDLRLHSITGNVWEWCWDWYDSDYYEKSQNARNPTGPAGGVYRVLRGGSWNNKPARVRVAYRNGITPGNRLNGLGFRLARAGR